MKFLSFFLCLYIQSKIRFLCRTFAVLVLLFRGISDMFIFLFSTKLFYDRTKWIEYLNSGRTNLKIFFLFLPSIGKIWLLFLSPRIFPSTLSSARELVAHKYPQPVVVSQAASVMSSAAELVNTWQRFQTHSLLSLFFFLSALSSLSVTSHHSCCLNPINKALSHRLKVASFQSNRLEILLSCSSQWCHPGSETWVFSNCLERGFLHQSQFRINGERKIF